MATTTTTPEAHHDALMREIDHEVNTYGVASLAGLIASELEVRCDSEDNSPKAEHYRTAVRLFEELADKLTRLRRPFDLPDTQVTRGEEE